MSSPSPDFDQLLSDHLDGRLDENDARILDAKLRDDAALRSQYDAMLADRERMKALFASSVQSQPRLSADFASRVLAEGRRRGLAVSRDNETLASSENASVASPVQRSSTQSASHRSRWTVGIAASAAAVLILVLWSLSGRTDVGNVSTIAQNTEPANALSVDTQAIPNTLADSKITEPAIAPVDVTDASPSLMASDVAAESDVDAETPLIDVELMDVAPKPAAASIASAAAPASMDMSSSVSIGSDDSPALDASSLAGALMVYDVRLNQKGRVSGVFAQAMQRNGLDETSRAAVNRDVIAAAKRADVFDQDESFQIVFLQASAKKIDRLFLDLLKEDEQVESIGLSLVMDTPILQMTDRLAHVDATEVKHQQPISLQLGNGADDKELETLRDLLGDQTFMPLSPMTANMNAGGESLSSSGTDVISRVLILVR